MDTPELPPSEQSRPSPGTSDMVLGEAVQAAQRIFDLDERERAVLEELPEGQAALQVIKQQRAIISEQQRTIETTAQAATYDKLTGLLRGERWLEDMQERMNKGQAFGIALLDMDGFKKVNDKFGHDYGDKLLQAFGVHMRSAFRRQSDAVSARLGGDEFGLTFDMEENGARSEGGPQARYEREQKYVRSVIDAFVTKQPLQISELGFGISIGFGKWQLGMEPNAVQFRAQIDKALYEQKVIQHHDAAQEHLKRLENTNVTFS